MRYKMMSAVAVALLFGTPAYAQVAGRATAPDFQASQGHPLRNPDPSLGQATDRDYDVFQGRPSSNQDPLSKRVLDRAQVSQVRRWAQVGRCVAAQDRPESLAYVTAASDSAAAADGAQHLAPVFSSCLVGSGISDMGNRRFRRAALADALGIPIGRN